MTVVVEHFILIYQLSISLRLLFIKALFSNYVAFGKEKS